MFSSTHSLGFFSITIALASVCNSCARTPAGSELRVAIVPFENLTADRDLDWFGRALGAILVARTSGSELRSFEAPGVREAQALKASRIIQGYFTQENGGLRAYATERAEDNGRVVRTVSATGKPSEIGAIAEKLSRQLAADVRPYTTTNPVAVREAFSGEPAKALEADSAYGFAHLMNIQQLLKQNRRDEAAEAISAARNSTLTEIERARLELLAEEIKGTPESRIAALTKLAKASPAEPQLWRTIAELQMLRKEYRAAADAYAEWLEFSPADQVVLNSHAYALAFAGDFEGARRGFEEYGRVVPDDANPLDSLGEVQFCYGRFSEAARSFLSANEKNPQALGGFEPFRAALSRFMSGDREQADRDMSAFLAARKKAGDQTADVRAELWRWMTGREPKLDGQASIDQAANALRLLVAGDRERARMAAESARRSAALPNAVALSSTVLVLSQPSAPAEIWRDRIAKALPRPEQAAIRHRLLGFALLLDGRYPEAAEVWRRIYDATSGLTANDERIALVWALEGAGKHDEARKIMGRGFLPPASLEPGLELVVHRKAIELMRNRGAGSN